MSALAVAPLAFFERRRAGRPGARRAWRLAVVIGVLLFLGASLQQAGLATTSATNGGFLTACYVVLTPFVVWALSRTRPRAVVLAAGAVSFVGAWLLAGGRRAGRAADDRRRAGAARRPRLGDRDRADADLSRAGRNGR